MHNDFLTLLVGKQEYKVRPTFQAASYIQAHTKKPLAQAIFAAKALSITDLHAILCGALEGNGHKADLDALGDAIIADYATHETALINQVLAFGDAFFPKIESEGTKKQTATEVTG